MELEDYTQSDSNKDDEKITKQDAIDFLGLTATFAHIMVKGGSSTFNESTLDRLILIEAIGDKLADQVIKKSVYADYHLLDDCRIYYVNSSSSNYKDVYYYFNNLIKDPLYAQKFRDYFLDSSRLPYKSSGEEDFESSEAIDSITDILNHHNSINKVDRVKDLITSCYSFSSLIHTFSWSSPINYKIALIHYQKNVIKDQIQNNGGKVTSHHLQVFLDKDYRTIDTLGKLATAAYFFKPLNSLQDYVLKCINDSTGGGVSIEGSCKSISDKLNVNDYNEFLNDCRLIYMKQNQSELLTWLEQHHSSIKDKAEIIGDSNDYIIDQYIFGESHDLSLVKLEMYRRYPKFFNTLYVSNKYLKILQRQSFSRLEMSIKDESLESQLDVYLGMIQVMSQIYSIVHYQTSHQNQNLVYAIKKVFTENMIDPSIIISLLRSGTFDLNDAYFYFFHCKRTYIHSHSDALKSWVLNHTSYNHEQYFQLVNKLLAYKFNNGSFIDYSESDKFQRSDIMHSISNWRNIMNISADEVYNTLVSRDTYKLKTYQHQKAHKKQQVQHIKQHLLVKKKHKAHVKKVHKKRMNHLYKASKSPFQNLTKWYRKQQKKYEKTVHLD